MSNSIPHLDVLPCDSESGVCAAPSLEATLVHASAVKPDWELTYVGDPMCSWCWGVAPLVAHLPDYCSERGASFSIITGGLRPGGGDPWNDQFRAFLRQHWTEVSRATGQRFEMDLLEREQFNYDTEPACRAVVVARSLIAGTDANDRSLAAFFAALQHRFYVENQEPGDLDFYREPVAAIGLDFASFSEHYASPAARVATLDEFRINRSWGVRGFPSFVLRNGERAEVLASGFIDLPTLDARIRHSVLRQTVQGVGVMGSAPTDTESR